MMFKTLRRTATRRAGLVVCAFLCAAQIAEAQIGTGGRRGGIAGGSGLRIGGRNDEAAHDAAVQRKASKYLEDGSRLLAEGKIQAAKTKFKSVIEMVGLQGLGQSALSQLKAIHRQGMQRLDEATKLFQEGKYLEAIDLAETTRVQYGNLFGGIQGVEQMPNVSHLARQLAEQINAHPATIVAIQEDKASRRTKRLRVLERQAKKDPLKHYDLYKLVSNVAKRFPDCPTGRLCAARKKELRADKKLYRIIKKESRRRFIAAALDRIEQYKRLGKPDEARTELAALRKKFPGKTLAELRRMAEK